LYRINSVLGDLMKFCGDQLKIHSGLTLILFVFESSGLSARPLVIDPRGGFVSFWGELFVEEKHDHTLKSVNW
jgi:hypothetical protein